MEDTKKWWQSKGVLGSAVALVAIALRFFGYEIDPAAEEQLTSTLLEGIAAVGALIALIGRITADKRIG